MAVKVKRFDIQRVCGSKSVNSVARSGLVDDQQGNHRDAAESV